MDRDDREWLKALLATHGIKMKVGGCGCCGSPWLKVETAERSLKADNASFSMFDATDAENDRQVDEQAARMAAIRAAMADESDRSQGETEIQRFARIEREIRDAAAFLAKAEG